MTVHNITDRIQKYVGDSSDTKPTPDFPGSEFYELNTGQNWIWDGTDWIEDLRLFKAMVDALAEV